MLLGAKRFINHIESRAIPCHLYFISFLSIVLLRYIGEGYSQPDQYLDYASVDYLWSFFHTVVSYIALGLGFVAILRMIASIPLANALRLIMAGYIIILMTPILDLLFGLFTSWSTANRYIHGQMHTNILHAYFTMYDGFVGMSSGLRIEIISLFIAFFIYFHMKNFRLVSCFILTWICYTWLFFMSCSPYVVSILWNSFGLIYQYNNPTMINYFVVVSLLIITLLWLYDSGFYNVKKFILNKNMAIVVESLLFGSVCAYLLMTNSFTDQLIIKNIIFHEIMLAISLAMLVSDFEVSDLDSFFILCSALSITMLVNTRLLFLFLVFMLVNEKNKGWMTQILKIITLTILGMASVYYFSSIPEG